MAKSIFFLFLLFVVYSCEKKPKFHEGECIMAPDGAVFKIFDFKSGEYSASFWERKAEKFSNPKTYSLSEFEHYFKIDCPH